MAEDLQRSSVSHVSPGWVVGSTSATVRELQAFPLATNAYEVIATCRRADLGNEIEHIRSALRHVPRPGGLPARSTFRLRIHDDGTFVTTKSDAATRLESEIARWSGLARSPRGARIEFWVVRRREQDTMLATKLTSGNPRVERGVLRPEVCAALARDADVVKASIVLDPFAGSGSIGLACLRAGAAAVWLNDRDRGALHLGSWEPPLRRRAKVTHEDFRRLRGDVSHIVTDPPWGHYQEHADRIEDLYYSIGEMAARLLRPPGVLVVLTGAGDGAIQAMITSGGLLEAERSRVLINGRKATVVRASLE